MHIIAIGWIYVVSMMALTETSLIAGLMTFIFYCAIPLGLIWYFVKRKKHSPSEQHATHYINELKHQQHDSNKSQDKLEIETE